MPSLQCLRTFFSFLSFVVAAFFLSHSCHNLCHCRATVPFVFSIVFILLDVSTTLQSPPPTRPDKMNGHSFHCLRTYNVFFLLHVARNSTEKNWVNICLWALVFVPFAAPHARYSKRYTLYFLLYFCLLSVFLMLRHVWFFPSRVERGLRGNLNVNGHKKIYISVLCVYCTHKSSVGVQ